MTTSVVRMGRKPRLAILAPHVVQYHDPLYREIAATGAVEAHVFYCSRQGLEPWFDATMGATIHWDITLLQGYAHSFLPNLSRWPHHALLNRVNPAIISILATRYFDVIMLQSYANLTAWLALGAARAAGVRVLFRGEGSPRRKAAGLRAYAQRAVVAGFIRAADLALYSCSGNRAWLEELGMPSERLVFAPCAVDNDFFQAEYQTLRLERSGVRARLGLRDDLVYLLSVARLAPYKRVGDIVQAVVALQRAGLPLGLIVLGDGPERSMIEQQIQVAEARDIHLCGFVNGSGVSAYYAAADIFALASDYDPSPKALTEALHFGLPMICSAAAGTAGDQVRDGWNGLLYPAGDLLMLMAHIRSLAGDAEQRRRMGRRSRALAGVWAMRATANAVVEATYRVLR